MVEPLPIRSAMHETQNGKMDSGCCATRVTAVEQLAGAPVGGKSGASLLMNNQGGLARWSFESVPLHRGFCPPKKRTSHSFHDHDSLLNKHSSPFLNQLGGCCNSQGLSACNRKL